jgi:prepilin-type N-terminal cleavage/methylation domain-containing protein
MARGSRLDAPDTANAKRMVRVSSERGFSLIELLVATGVMLAISATVTSALLQMTNSQQTIWNRTAMHSGVRSATELLQQEVGQAGRVALPATVTLSGAVSAGSHTVTVSAAAGMFQNELLTVGTGDGLETVTVTAVNTGANQFTATFGTSHAAGDPVRALGGFATGVVPTTLAHGSTSTILKLYGDINGDGQMVYVEYTCDTAAGFLYRNTMPFDAGVKPSLTTAHVLLNDVQANPGSDGCFTYEQKNINGVTFVIDVAITLTVRTQHKDPVTHAYQKETKALLNVAPRNVFNAWELASISSNNRIQPMPATITALLP